MISLASTFLVSCSSDGEYTFRSPDDALRKYQNYASFLHGETALDTDRLIDALCVALLTDAQKEQLLGIAEDFQKSLQSSKLDDATLRLMTEEIPKQILKLYISSL